VLLEDGGNVFLLELGSRPFQRPATRTHTGAAVEPHVRQDILERDAAYPCMPFDHTRRAGA
jgi:hypothetical protein